MANRPEWRSRHGRSREARRPTRMQLPLPRRRPSLGRPVSIPLTRPGRSPSSLGETSACEGERMKTHGTLTRRSFLASSGVGAAAVLSGGVPTIARMGTAMAAPTGALYQAARAKGILYGSSTATWQFEPDPDYAALFAREAGMAFTEDDLLWYRLRVS